MTAWRRSSSAGRSDITMAPSYAAGPLWSRGAYTRSLSSGDGRRALAVGREAERKGERREAEQGEERQRAGRLRQFFLGRLIAGHGRLRRDRRRLNDLGHRHFLLFRRDGHD